MSTHFYEWFIKNIQNERIDVWGGGIDMNLSKIKWLNILLNVIVLVVLPLIGGMLIYTYIEYVLVVIFIVPGFIAFLGGGLKNGAKIK